MGRKKRYCLDCNKIISDKRFKDYNKGLRCPECRAEHLREYSQYYEKNKRRTRIGCRADKKTRLRIAQYVHMHRMRSAYMVRVRVNGGYIFFYDKQYREFLDPNNILSKKIDNGEPRYIEDIIEQYGEGNVKVLPQTRDVY